MDGYSQVHAGYGAQLVVLGQYSIDQAAALLRMPARRAGAAGGGKQNGGG